MSKVLSISTFLHLCFSAFLHWRLSFDENGDDLSFSRGISVLPYCYCTYHCIYVHCTYCQLYLLGISLPAQRTCTQSYNFRSIWVAEIHFTKNALSIITQSATHKSTQPPTYAPTQPPSHRVSSIWYARASAALRNCYSRTFHRSYVFLSPNQQCQSLETSASLIYYDTNIKQ